MLLSPFTLSNSASHSPVLKIALDSDKLCYILFDAYGHSIVVVLGFLSLHRHGSENR